jgi:cell wall-associated NlpC family hydrolase
MADRDLPPAAELIEAQRGVEASVASLASARARARTEIGQLAERLVGRPYVWGGAGGFDCSGLTDEAAKRGTVNG